MLTELLREEWGFDGAVISDWGGTMSLGPAVSAGCDLEMPGPGSRSRHLADGGVGGEVAEADVDLAASRVARLARRAADAAGDLGDGPDPDDVAYRVAVAGTVLLRNEGDVLPLTADATTVAVIGPCADPGQIMGGGSSQVNPAHRISPVDGLRARLGDGAVRHEPGCDITRFAPSIRARTLSWEGRAGRLVRAVRHARPHRRAGAGRADPQAAAPGSSVPSRGSPTRPASPPGSGPLSPRSTSGPHRLGVVCAGQAKVSVDGAVVIEQDSATDPGDSFYSWGSGEATATLDLEVGVPVEIEVEYRRGERGGHGGRGARSRPTARRRGR